MTNYFNQLFEWVDGLPRRKPSRGQRTGDSDPGDTPTKDKAMMTDAHGFAAGHRRGYVFNNRLPTNDAALRVSRERAQAAYDERSKRLHHHKPTQDDDERTNDVERLRQIADGAYEDRRTRLSNLWRERRHGR
jgi:hypothetical protein